MMTNKAYKKIISTVNLPREEWLKARRGVLEVATLAQ